MTDTVAAIALNRGQVLRNYALTLVLGYSCFILPNLFFGITGFGGGLSGWNLLWCGLFQLFSVVWLLRYSLRRQGLTLADIGWTLHWKQRDIYLALLCGGAWLLLQFGWLIPLTGGAARADIAAIRLTLETGYSSWLGYLGLAILGGGLAEELFNRGYVIRVLRRCFRRATLGLIVATGFSVLLFAAGHLPVTLLDWIDILIPTLIYTALFLYTGRLTASVLAHSFYNASTVLLIGVLY